MTCWASWAPGRGRCTWRRFATPTLSWKRSDMATEAPPEERQPAAPGQILAPGYTPGSVTDQISAIVLSRPTGRRWYIGFGIAFLLVMMLNTAIGYLFIRGTGIWG